MKYDKLVRDKIVASLQEQGLTVSYRVVSKEEYVSYLRKKLQEEVDEYLMSASVEELADILEVVCSLAKAQGCDVEELMLVREQKAKDKGSFDKRIVLMSCEE